MPLGNKALKRREQATDAKNGVVRDALVLKKAATAKKDVKCAVCSTTFKLTKKNVDARAHADSKHPTRTFADCFAECVAFEAEEAGIGGGGGGSGGAAAPAAAAKPAKKKEDATLSMLSEGLAGDATKGKKK
mmetsp:Transcript_649/g.2355  ORF Transcript_649/g.2355 Transcript_649/m.2355 type:complete len:132 (-) Transcript_649:1005-1400(-)